MSRFRLLFVLLTGVLLTTGTLHAQEVRRIVSLASSLTKNIQYLGSEDLLVGCTNYCQTNRNVEIVASAVRVYIEKAVSVKPDLIIATTITDNETLEILRKFGIRVKVFPKCRSFEDICSQFLELGRLIGKENMALTLIRNSREKVELLQKSVFTKQKLKIFLQIGADPLYTVFPNTFMDDYIRYAGGQNIASDFTIGSITRESVLMRNPDVILIVSMGLVSEEEKKKWERVEELNAARNKKIFIIDSDKASTPTPVTFVETLETIITLIYGQ